MCVCVCVYVYQRAGVYELNCIYISVNSTAVIELRGG